jgi:hypothetical protein
MIHRIFKLNFLVISKLLAIADFVTLRIVYIKLIDQ